MSKNFKIKSKKELKKMSVSEIENYLEELQNYLDYNNSEELFELEKLVSEMLLEKYSG